MLMCLRVVIIMCSLIASKSSCTTSLTTKRCIVPQTHAMMIVKEATFQLYESKSFARNSSCIK
jgi:hypothetical protein